MAVENIEAGPSLEKLPYNREEVVSALNSASSIWQGRISKLQRSVDPKTKMEIDDLARTELVDEVQRDQFARFRVFQKGLRGLTGSAALYLWNGQRETTITTRFQDPVTKQWFERPEGLDVADLINETKAEINELDAQLADPKVWGRKRLEKEKEEARKAFDILTASSKSYLMLHPNALDPNDPEERGRLHEEAQRVGNFVLTASQNSDSEAASRENFETAQDRLAKRVELIIPEKEPEKPVVTEEVYVVEDLIPVDPSGGKDVVDNKPINGSTSESGRSADGSVANIDVSTGRQRGGFDRGEEKLSAFERLVELEKRRMENRGATTSTSSSGLSEDKEFMSPWRTKEREKDGGNPINEGIRWRKRVGSMLDELGDLGKDIGSDISGSLRRRTDLLTNLRLPKVNGRILGWVTLATLVALVGAAAFKSCENPSILALIGQEQKPASSTKPATMPEAVVPNTPDYGPGTVFPQPSEDNSSNEERVDEEIKINVPPLPIPVQVRLTPRRIESGQWVRRVIEADLRKAAPQRTPKEIDRLASVATLTAVLDNSKLNLDNIQAGTEVLLRDFTEYAQKGDPNDPRIDQAYRFIQEGKSNEATALGELIYIQAHLTQ